MKDDEILKMAQESEHLIQELLPKLEDFIISWVDAHPKETVESISYALIRALNITLGETLGKAAMVFGRDLKDFGFEELMQESKIVASTYVKKVNFDLLNKKTDTLTQ